MSDSIHATCPGCREALRIPASWVGRAFKCKKCGAVMKAKAPEEPVATPPSPTNPTANAPSPFAFSSESEARNSEPTPAPVSTPLPQTPPAITPVPGYPGYTPPAPGYAYPQAGQPYAPMGYGQPAMPGQPYPGAPMGYPYPQPGQPGYGMPTNYPGYPPTGYLPPGYPPQPGYPGISPAMPGYPQTQVPGYPPAPPVGAEPAAVPIQNAFAAVQAQEEAQSAAHPKKKKKYKKGGGSGKYLVIGVAALLMVGGGLAFAKFGLPAITKAKRKETKAQEAGQTPTTNPSAGNTRVISSASGPAPRRALMLNVTNYLFANPLSNGIGFKRVQIKEIANTLKVRWRIPTEKDNNQVFLLTDVQGAGPESYRPMLKPIIEQALTDFCTTSRNQDRLLIYFGGHATMIDDQAYLVPSEGDFAEPETLIPLADFYAKVAASPAQQKIVIFDVCRMNTDGDKQRSAGTQPMSEELEKALLAPPAGIQVITSCSAGQHALEIRTPLVIDSTKPDADLKGSLFLSLLKRALDSGKVPADKLKPEESLPVEEWVSQATAYGSELFAARPELLDVVEKKAPTPKWAGTPGPAVEYVSTEAPAPRFAYKEAPPRYEGPEIKLADELLGLPPIRPLNENDTKQESLLELSYFFTEAAMKDYKNDMKPEDALAMKDKFPIRAATVKALMLLKEKWKEGAEIRTQFSGETSNNVKEAIKKEQTPLARLTIDLEEVMEEMTAVEPMLEKEESKFWKATFKFALAQVKLRYAFSQEANLALGMILTESLPEQLDKARGLQLVSTDKMKSRKEERKIADEGREILSELVKDHKGTPWEVAAKRTRSVAIGLEWRPYVPMEEMKSDE